MKAFIYKIEVCDGLAAFSHGWSNDIDEMYIPDISMYINSENCFLKNSKRFNEHNIHQKITGEKEVKPLSIKEIELGINEQDILEKMAEILKQKDKLKELSLGIFNRIIKE